MTDADLPHPDIADAGGPKGNRLSEMLVAIAEADGERISIGELLQVLHHRALAALMFIFALPIALPAPPGLSSVLGAPLLFLTVQLMLGLPPWLPRVIADRSFARADFAKVVTAAAPWLAKAERLMKPRLQIFTTGLAKNVIGFLCLWMAIILSLPIPLGNMLPAFTICVFALALLSHDGFWVAVGALLSITAVAVIWGVVWAAIFGISLLMSNYFGW